MSQAYVPTDDDRAYLASQHQIFVQFDLQTFATPVTELVRGVEEHKICADTPYQRGLVWDTARQRNLWRSRLLGLPIGAIFLNIRPGDDTYTRYVVDGQQRLAALHAFVYGDLALPRDWFPPRIVAAGTAISHSIPEDFAGEWVHFDDLTASGRGMVKMHNAIPVIESRVAGEAEEAEIYLAINFSGVAQTDDDRLRATAVAATGTDPSLAGAGVHSVMMQGVDEAAAAAAIADAYPANSAPTATHKSDQMTAEKLVAQLAETSPADSYGVGSTLLDDDGTEVDEFVRGNH